MKAKIELKRDKFKSARGGYSRLYDVCCRKCDSVIVVYQKDGPGSLRRLYMDRIFAPDSLVGLQYNDLTKISPLGCPKCGYVVAMPYIFIKENRKAFRLFQDAVVKRLVKIKN
ncbi:MAG: hypothetical protein WCK11_03930 [Candidatus Falkowbacteria bacterium]